jgi:hypothetical protein
VCQVIHPPVPALLFLSFSLSPFPPASAPLCSFSAPPLLLLFSPTIFYLDSLPRSGVLIILHNPLTIS